MARISPQRLSNQVARLMYWLLFIFVAALFFSTLHHFLITAQFAALAVVCAPTLALLFGFSGLLYGRARALSPGVEQRRCLYAAERALQAALIFMLAAALGALIAAFLWAQAQAKPELLQDQIGLFYWFFVPIFLALMAFGAFFFSVRTVSHRLLRWVQMRDLARRLKNGL